MTIAKLIERLRSPVFGTQTALEAADALASSQEEIARLEEELAEFDETNRMMVKHADMRKDEIARLRKALEEAQQGIIAVIGEDSPVEGLLFGDFPDGKSITITAPLGAFRRARAAARALASKAGAA